MKKSILIAIVLFLVSTVLYNILNVTINEQILSRILFGTDYTTYITNYYSGQAGFLDLISGDRMDYEWIFTISKYTIVIFCIFIVFIVIKKISKKYTVNKKEFIIAISIFSILSLYDFILYIVMFSKIPPVNFFALPFVFIISTFIGIYKIMCLQKEV